MFDTIKLKANNIYIEDSIFEKLVDKVEDTTYFDRVTGELNTVYKLKDEKIPYLVYYTNSRILTLQVSIPKFLFGNNIKMVAQNDISDFFTKLNNHLLTLLHINVVPADWTITSRLDVSWNFQVGTNVSDYIMQLAKRKMPYKNTNVYNHNETVIFENKSSRIMFYDKMKQCVKTKESDEIIKQAEGILRLEISPSTADIKKFSPKKKAIELLTREFFEHITKPILEGITFHNIDNELNLEWLKQQKSISSAETILGFKKISETYGDSVLKELYSAKTLLNRKNMIEPIVFPKVNKLKDLKIDL
ncbi:hypothetical protein SAMN04487897_102562 [Paenibacillus sp. yr247]|uniref:hypothetical protein n=1 Tax=Paenibacillus sp. yr247 TaxID=1761880 RepID=UPI000892075E|nr:hypothetical protein [Paenibacillus sp. yr247]SDN33948.1 hypothetical protein SAMN04487897_102562 [Paenibacillus sp. yr247]